MAYTIVLANVKTSAQQKAEEHFRRYFPEAIIHLNDCEYTNNKGYNTSLIQIVGYKGEEYLKESGVYRLSVKVKLNLTRLYEKLGVPANQLPEGETPEGDEGDAWATGIFKFDDFVEFEGKWVESATYKQLKNWASGLRLDEEGDIICEKGDTKSVPSEFKLSKSWVAVTFSDEIVEKNGKAYRPAKDISYNPKQLRVQYGPQGGSATIPMLLEEVQQYFA